MNREGEKYKLVLYNFKVWITNGEHIEFITPLWSHLKVYRYKSWLIFVLNE